MKTRLNRKPAPIAALVVSRPVPLDHSGHTVATSDGFVVQPDSLLMASLCNGDEARHIDRSRYLVNA